MLLLVYGHGGSTQNQKGGEELHEKQTARVQVKYALDHCALVSSPNHCDFR